VKAAPEDEKAGARYVCARGSPFTPLAQADDVLRTRETKLRCVSPDYHSTSTLDLYCPIRSLPPFSCIPWRITRP
jgi:hypothetical protein